MKVIFGHSVSEHLLTNPPVEISGHSGPPNIMKSTQKDDAAFGTCIDVMYELHLVRTVLLFNAPMQTIRYLLDKITTLSLEQDNCKFVH